MLRPIDLGNPVNRGASLNLGLAHWYRGLPNNRGARTIFDLCKAANFTITDGSGYATAMWSPKHALCDFSPVGGVGPAWCGTSDSNLADFSNGFTASAWIFPVDVSTYNVVAGVTSTGVTNGFYFGQSGAGLILNASPGAVQQFVGPNIAAYSPSFAVWVCSGGAVRLYVDSIEVQNFGGGYSSPAGASWYIGNSAYGYGTNGGIGSLRFYARGLTASEVVALYEEELAGCPTTLNRYTPRTMVFLGGAAAAPVSATPGVASLTTTRYAPTASTPRLATPAVKSLATTRYAPAVQTPRTSTPGKLSLTTTRYAPVAAAPRLATPGRLSVAITPLAPTARTPRVVTVGVRSLSATVLAPVVSTPRTSTPSVASLTLAAFAPTVAAPRSATPSMALLASTGYAPAVLLPRVTTPAVATLSLTSFAPVAATPRAAVPDAAALALTGFAPVAVAPRTTTPTGGPAPHHIRRANALSGGLLTLGGGL